MKLRGYLASHFFNSAGLEWTARLAERIRKETPIELYVPQENGEINDKEENDATITDKKIYVADTNELLGSNVLIASLDGVEIDSGVACEIGAFGAYKHAEAEVAQMIPGYPFMPRMIIGINTDMRQNGTGDNRLYRNLYVTGTVRSMGVIVSSEDELIGAINEFVSAVDKIVKENNAGDGEDEQR